MSTVESPHPFEPTAFVVMGVSGSGKTVVGEAMARDLGLPFLEGDGLHPKANIDKMSRGIPLSDDDRLPWLDKIGAELAATLATGGGMVVSCSALKRIYRDRLRAASRGRLIFIYLRGSEAVLAPRMRARKGHFMPASLLKSQLATLEDPSGEPGVLTIDIAGTTDEVTAEAIRQARTSIGAA